MDSAIIAGSHGLIGSEVSKYFQERGIKTLRLGRKKRIQNSDNNNIYLPIEMKNIAELKTLIKKINFIPGKECVFFNFAWSGENKLTDGSFTTQLNNSIYSAEALKIAKDIGCCKYIDSGSMEETYAEKILNNDSKIDLTQENYAIAKITSRDISKIVAYLEKIDYVHTRISVPLDLELKKGGYITNVIKKIISNEEFESPKNTKIFNFISTRDIAEAYYLIGCKAENKSDYFIGNKQNSFTLKDFFDDITQMIKKEAYEESNNNYFIDKNFDTDPIRLDLGFESKMDLKSIVKEFINKK
tara:strand:- start:71 stop:970 length:900 start_codon:yes stop_codon:yes gene_type:complete